MIQLMIADIDGTLRGKKSRMPGPMTLRAFEQMHQEGILLGIASGRPLWQGVEEHHHEWNLSFQFDLLIGMNGGEIKTIHNQHKRDFHPLSIETLKEIVTTLHHFSGINPFVYQEGSELSLFFDEEMKESGQRHHCPVFQCKDESDLYAKPTAKILYRCDTIEIAEEVEQYARQKFGSRIASFRTGPDLVELQNPEVNKGSGLKIYCEENQIPLTNVLAFGDAENDIQMLDIAGQSICLCDGMDDAKAHADALTDYGVDEDGVGRYLYDHHILGGYNNE